MIIWVSKHIITKPYEYQKDNHVDSAGLDGRAFVRLRRRDLGLDLVFL